MHQYFSTTNVCKPLYQVINYRVLYKHSTQIHFQLMTVLMLIIDELNVGETTYDCHMIKVECGVCRTRHILICLMYRSLPNCRILSTHSARVHAKSLHNGTSFHRGITIELKCVR